MSTSGDPLRVSDLVPLRRMLGTDSIVIRVHPDGSFEPFQRMPALFFDRSIRRVLDNTDQGAFDEACARSIADRRPVSFRHDASSEELLINPILDDEADICRFLVCWIRQGDGVDTEGGRVAWTDLALDDIITRYRRTADAPSAVVDAAPWWLLRNGEPLELWPHHRHVSAMGLGHAVMQAVIMDAAEAVADTGGGGPAVRIMVPSADMLAGLVPVFHGALSMSGIEPSRLVVGIDVELAVDPDLLPIIVHLRTLGLQIDIVGLDALTRTLHTVSDTSAISLKPAVVKPAPAGDWACSLPEAIEAA